MRLRTIWDVRVFSVTLTTGVILGGLILHHMLLPPDLAQRVRWPGILILFMLAAPLTYFSGLRLYDIQRLNMDVKEAAQRDPLTGLLSRHAFVDRVRTRTDRCGILIMADIDNFKRYNDAYGHAAGDAALTRVAHVFATSCRAEDLAARYGGEEFMIFLPDTGRDDGVAVAERLRRRLASTPLQHNGQSLKLTASFGVACLAHDTDLDVAIQRADAALYQSKHKGRNRVSETP